MIRVVDAQLIFPAALHIAHLDRVLDPLFVIELAGVEEVEIQLGLRLGSDLVRGTLGIFDASATVSFDQSSQLFSLFNLRDEEH